MEPDDLARWLTISGPLAYVVVPPVGVMKKSSPRAAGVRGEDR
jgi:hypothetical protein